MYDFNYVLGAAVMNPAIIGWVENLKALPLAELNQRTVTTIDASGVSKTVSDKTKSVGKAGPLALKPEIDDFRSKFVVALRGKLFLMDKTAIPPVGVFTAGKMAQFVARGILNSKGGYLMDANRAFENIVVPVIAGVGMPIHLPAMLGYLLCDNALATLLEKQMPDPVADGIWDEFDIVDPVRSALVKYSMAVTKTRQDFLTDGWDELCTEQLMFYSDKLENSILG